MRNRVREYSWREYTSIHWGSQELSHFHEHVVSGANPRRGARILTKCVPKLALAPGNTIDKDIPSLPQRQTNRPTVLVPLVPVLVVPQLALPVKQRLAEAEEREVAAAEHPGGAAARVDDADAAAQPVLDVAGPAQRPVDLDGRVGQVQRPHDLADVEEALGQDHAPVFAALLERREDLRRVVGLLAAAGWRERRHGAGRPVDCQRGVHGGTGEEEGGEECLEQHIGRFGELIQNPVRRQRPISQSEDGYPRGMTCGLV